MPRLAQLLESAGNATAILEGRSRLRGRDASVANALARRVTPDALEDWSRVLSETLARSPGTRLVTLTDAEYPRNLRTARHRPVFVFLKGDLVPGDDRAVAVVGSRRASPEGLALAAEISSRLAADGVTVVSGLAAGIDGAAHSAAIAGGGRTLAAIGTGVDRVYPSEHASLAEAIVRSGALVSRFWPEAPPTRRAFRSRNEVTGGLALATVVIEAGPTGGTRLQARLCLEQRRPVVLSPLVSGQEWARRIVGQPDVIAARDADEIIASLRDLVVEPSAQLSLF